MFSAFNPSKCTHTWSSGQPTVQQPGGAVVDFRSELGFEPTTLGYLGFQVQRSIHRPRLPIKSLKNHLSQFGTVESFESVRGSAGARII